MGLDGLAKQQAQQHSRHKGNQHIERQALCLRLAAQTDDSRAQLVPIDQDHGKNSTGLYRDVKHLGFFVVKTQQGAGQNQVAGG